MEITNTLIIDAIIVLIILMGGIVGFKQGVFKTLVNAVGLIIVVILAFKFKNQLSSFFYENLPFFDLWGVFKGIQVLNILFYETLAFLIIASVLMIAYNLLLSITGLIEKILKATVILSIPSKILGFIVGLIESYIWVYVALFVLTLPIFNIRDINNAKTTQYILGNTPILSKYTSKTMSIYQDIHNIIDNRGEKTNEEINEESLDAMLRYDVIDVAAAKQLIEKNKISVKDPTFINKYE